MTEATIVELDEKGAVRLPESIRHDLPSGTHFLIRRQDQDIILHALPPRPAVSFDLSSQAFSFANELTADEYDDHLVQAALTNASQAD
jgi:virulence-associated protein VagC